MQGRFDLVNSSGGDKIQIEQTASELRKLGVNVDIVYDTVSDYSKHEIVHIFQLDWTPETHFFAKDAKRASKPVVFSPIHHNVAEVKKFDDECVYDYRRIAKYIFREQHQRDTFKNVYRSILNRNKIKPTLYSVFHGLKNMHRETLILSDVILVQTKLEAKDLKETYGVDINWQIVPNGVGSHFLHTEGLTNPLPFADYIFAVGRIEPRKNQLNLISAVKKLRQESQVDFKLVLVGLPNKLNHYEYTIRFNNELKKNNWITYIPQVAYKEIPAYFKYAKVCVNASWFETTGLTLLEALYCGTNAVATSPRAKEVLGDLVTYCRPNDIVSIKEAILKEYLSKRPQIPKEMQKEYTWETAAEKTLAVYKTLI